MDAIKDYTTEIQINPLCAESYNNRGRKYDQYLKGFSYIKLERIEEAMKNFSKAIEINP